MPVMMTKAACRPDDSLQAHPAGAIQQLPDGVDDVDKVSWEGGKTWRDSLVEVSKEGEQSYLGTSNPKIRVEASAIQSK